MQPTEQHTGVNELILKPEDNKGIIVLPSGTKASETMVQAVGATNTYVK